MPHPISPQFLVTLQSQTGFIPRALYKAHSTYQIQDKEDANTWWTESVLARLGVNNTRQNDKKDYIIGKKIMDYNM